MIEDALSKYPQLAYDTQSFLDLLKSPETFYNDDLL